MSPVAGSSLAPAGGGPGPALSPPPALDKEDLGVIAVQLALHFVVWVRRRRFIVSYIDDTTIHQRMSVDFALPEPDWFWSTTSPSPGQTIYVPLHIPVKETLDQFSVFDEGGRRLSMLATAENGAIAVAGLVPPVRGLAPEATSTEDIEKALRAIVMAPKRPDYDPVVCVYEKELADGVLTKVLTRDDEIRAVVRDLASGFLMLVPVSYQPGEDRVLKAEWDVPNYWHGRREGRRLYRLGRRVLSCLASIGWSDKRQLIPELQIGWGRSTHVEVVAPPDVSMASAALRSVQYAAPGTSKTAVRTVFNKPRTTINIAPRVEYDPYEKDAKKREAVATAALQCRRDEASLELRFRSPPAGVLVAATTAAAMLTSLVWVASEHLDTLDRQTFSAVLLVFPAILAVYLLRPGEHDFARRLLTGVRLCGLGVAVCSIAVAAILGVATLTREKPTAAGKPGTQQLRCRATNSPGKGGRRPPAVRALVCESTPAVMSAVEPNPPVRTWTRRLAWAATGLSAVLLVGFLRTWLWSDLRNRNKADEYEDGE